MKVSRVAFGDGLRADAGFLTASWISTRGSTLQDKHTEDSCLPAFGSFLQPRRPVHDHVDRRYAGLFHWHWYEEAAVLANVEICAGCEARVKQGLRRSPVEIRSSLNLHCHQFLIGADEEQLLSVPTPDGTATAIRGNLPFGAEPGFMD